MKLDAAEESIKKQIIRVEDHLEFDKITMIARCFGKNYKGYQKVEFLSVRGTLFGVLSLR